MASACVCSSTSLIAGFHTSTSPPSTKTRAEHRPSQNAFPQLRNQPQSLLLLRPSASTFVAGSYPGFSAAASGGRRERRHGVTSSGAVCMAEDKKAEPAPGPAVWVGRVAMLAWTAAIATEVVTGKGLLANVGVTSPAPTLAVALTAVVGAATAFSLFSSASSE